MVKRIITNEVSKSIEEIEEYRYKLILLCRKSFWTFCKVLAPDFYKSNRTYLKNLCDIFQGIYDGTILNPNTKKPYKKLMLNMPPRMGKSRTTSLFCAWVLGRSIANKILAVSYNEILGNEFSRYVRDIISESRNDLLNGDVIYNDIFPKSIIKKGDSSIQRWALEGSHFSYAGTGMEGSLTGRGCNIALIDDPIKGANEAYSDIALDKVNNWYSRTFLSRLEGNNPITILIMTRWAKNDLCGYILNSEDAMNWYIFNLEACDDDGVMLCDDVLSKAKYNELKSAVDSAIFMSNYHQRPVDIKGRLFTNVRTYTDIPRSVDGLHLFKKIFAYLDYADKGKDNLCCIIAGLHDGYLYILDIVYTKSQDSEILVADALFKNKVSHCRVESNGGGFAFSKNLKEQLWTRHQSRDTRIEPFHNKLNKMSRILSNANNVINKVLFPKDWHRNYPEFFKDLMTFNKEGNNRYDDAPDTLTGLVEMQGNRNNIINLDNVITKSNLRKYSHIR